MRLRADNVSLLGELRKTRAARWLALAVLLMAGGAQLAASWHELAVRHVRCATHGELTHVRVATAARASGAGPALDTTLTSTSAGPLQTETTDAHEHCAVALIVQTGIEAPSAPVATRRNPPPAANHSTTIVVTPEQGRTIVLASAPKTSPPSV
ncbi:MAG: hypothetical protein QOI66_3663 [Myxococcales bacterium]|jgi:hypothetical protein|nr:hypothetical protein [Myxococcales bacterium]